MTSMHLNYSKKILFLALSIGLIPIAILSTIFYIDKVETETDYLKNYITLVSETGSKNISDWINDQKNNVFAIAQDNSLVSYTKKLSNSKIEKDESFESRFNLEDILNTYHENFPDYQNFVISNAKTGEIIFYTDLIPPKEELKNQNHFQQAVKGNIGMSDVFLSSTVMPNEFGDYEKNVPTFFISAPIKGEEGIKGILTVRVNAFKINSLIEQENNFHTEESYLINSEGYFLSKPRLLGESIYSGLIEKRPELELQIINPDSNQFTEIFQSANNENTVHNLNGYTNYLGNYVIGSISPVKGTDWSYVTEIEKNEAFSRITFIQILIIFVIIIVSLIIIGASFYFATRLTTPIKKLQNMAEQIIKGNLDIKIAINSKDEIGELSNSFDDMTKHLKKASMEIQSQFQELKKRDAQKDEFTTMISHELKTPLAPIMGYVELLKTPEMSMTAEQLECVNEIYANAERLESLISDVLDVQKIAFNEIKFNKTKLDLKEFFTKIKNSSAPLLSEKQIRLEISPTEITVNTDENRLHQVFNNLIRNSVDFVPNGGIISIGAKPQKDDVLFFVKDNGIGIPKEKEKELFKKFYQIDTSVTRKHGGTGLGLVICKGIIEGLGGRIWVESEEGKGATFYFTIPK